MRQIVLDTETTGLDPTSGHRIIEIACVELDSRRVTNNYFHAYLNPERKVDEAAFRIHGLSSMFLQDKPLFKNIVTEFIAFVQGTELIIHNAPFDLAFLNTELKRLNWPHSIDHYCAVYDTLIFARKKHPGQRNSLDALCKRYQIDNSERHLHGALLDARILAGVYLAMTGGQVNLFQNEMEFDPEMSLNKTKEDGISDICSPVIYATPEELQRHQDFIAFLNNTSSGHRHTKTKEKE